LHSTSSALLTGLAAVTAGVTTLELLVHAAAPRRSPRANSKTPPTERRDFLRWVGAATVVAAASALVGRELLARGAHAVAVARSKLSIPPARRRLPPPTRSMSVDVPGVSPLVTANGDFYKIDTALTYPQIDNHSWRLRIHGMVRTPLELDYDELVAMELVERYVTLQCVSNEVGGNLVSNALWRGVLLRDLLRRVGIDPRADQVIGRSIDAFTVGFPTNAALDDRGAMVAVAMNSEPLPIAHGFPARLIVPGLYGYVSATKWLVDLELSRFDRFDAYWVKRGWSQQGPIKTQSRIDVPTRSRPVRAGTIAVAGVAWAPTRGIATVEVQVDDQAWRPAQLADALGVDTWRQWAYPWKAAPGTHRLRVRATDGTGAVQDGRDHQPEPNGATGYHTVVIDVVG
jgi:DMSO/TMAO reductase YedYZ molybdopterin-dependent catalytic subunit